MNADESRVRLLDLRRQLEPIRSSLHDAAMSSIESGWFLLGDRTRAFEQEFSNWIGQSHGIACANGTDAITLALLALDLEPGSEVITVSTTAFASACGISRAGARPVFVDIDEQSWLIDAEQVRANLSSRTRAVLAVHLYGQVSDLEALRRVVPEGVEILEDCAQAHGAAYQGAKVGSLERLSCFSFYPSKNLGAVGDAGMVLTKDPDLAKKLEGLRFYGQMERDHHSSVGMNSRMDEIQAALLSVLLPHLETWLARRRQIAAYYDKALSPEVFGRPRPIEGSVPAYHLYPVRVRERDRLRRFLDERGIDTGIHYPVPIHLQPPFESTHGAAASLPRTEALCREIVSLPVAPHLTDEEVERVVATCGDYAEGFS